VTEAPKRANFEDASIEDCSVMEGMRAVEEAPEICGSFI